MKTSKKYLAILLTLCTLLCSIISYSVYAVTVEKETPISADADMGNEEELMPMAASACCTHTYTTRSFTNGTCPNGHGNVFGTEVICSKCGKGFIKLSCGCSFNIG